MRNPTLLVLEVPVSRQAASGERPLAHGEGSKALRPRCGKQKERSSRDGKSRRPGLLVFPDRGKHTSKKEVTSKNRFSEPRLCGTLRGRAVPWREGQATQAALDRLLFFCYTATGRTSNSMKLKGDVCTAQNFSEHALWLEPRRCRECKMLSLLKSIEKVVSNRPQTPQMMKKRRKPQGRAPSLRLSNWRGRGCPRPMALPHSPQLALL